MLAAASAGWGCARSFQATRLTLPSAHTLVRDQLVIHSDFPVSAQHRLVQELVTRRHDMSYLLGLPPDGEPIQVYLFDEAAPFNAFMARNYPQFPQRRAFFVQTDTRLEVYAYWGDRVAEDLRHEVAHGYLHSVAPNIPLWLDEGLAEFFEVPRGQGGLNVAHLETLAARLKRNQWQPNLERMERLDRPFEMTLDDYAECWAWVHFLLEGGPQHRELLRRFLTEVRVEESPRPFRWLLRQELGRPEEALIEHVRKLSAVPDGPKKDGPGLKSVGGVSDGDRG